MLEKIYINYYVLNKVKSRQLAFCPSRIGHLLITITTELRIMG